MYNYKKSARVITKAAAEVSRLGVVPLIRRLSLEDYDQIYRLWQSTPGVGLDNMDDSREGIQRFLLRNPSTSFVEEIDGRIVGVILGGHDGRRGHIYHACVETAYRRSAIGTKLVRKVIEAMKEDKITKVTLVAFKDNISGNTFWKQSGFLWREDLNYYALSLKDA